MPPRCASPLSPCPAPLVVAPSLEPPEAAAPSTSAVSAQPVRAADVVPAPPAGTASPMPAAQAPGAAAEGTADALHRCGHFLPSLLVMWPLVLPPACECVVQRGLVAPPPPLRKPPVPAAPSRWVASYAKLPSVWLAARRRSSCVFHLSTRTLAAPHSIGALPSRRSHTPALLLLLANRQDDAEQFAPDPLYDEHADDKDEAWVRARSAGGALAGQPTDAVLSCPACFHVLTYLCQQCVDRGRGGAGEVIRVAG
jgi:hypothetical protein